MKQFLKRNRFLLCMLLGITAGCVTGAVWPGAVCLEPLGTLFINLMFCAVVPTVFFSIASAIANMADVKQAGRIMGITLAAFFVTAGIAAILMYVVVRIIPITTGVYDTIEGEVAEGLSLTDMVLNFFTKPDFIELFSRKAILPLIVAAVLFGFGVQMAGGPETGIAKLMSEITRCMMNVVHIISYYAPIAFFGFFAYLVADYGPRLIGDYSRALAVYYIVSFVYLLVFSPIYARFGGGKHGIRVMLKHLFEPAVTAFGTCSSVATLPVNFRSASDSGVDTDVSDIVLPLGATMHMDGSAMSAIVKVAFLFGVFGMEFGTGRSILAILIAVFSSVAMSGIPGGGGTGELVLCSIFFPGQMTIAYPIAIALGNLVDPPATMVNAAGDYVVTFIVSRFVKGKNWLEKAVAEKRVR